MMKAWIFSIVGIVVLTVLLDLILEEGETKKYIKGIVALLAVIVIASPIPKLLKGDFKLPNNSIENQIHADNSYLKAMNERRKESNEALTVACLTANNIIGAEVESFLDITVTEYKLIKVIVRLKDFVITDDPPNINKNELILKIVSEGMKVEKEVITLECLKN